jgi:hypothetical protein
MLILVKVTGMGHLADVLHVSFVIRPEWNPTQPLHPSGIHVEVVESRQISQFVGWSGIVERMTDIIREDLGVPHIMQFKPKLEQVSPGFGYILDPTTRELMVRNITLATNIGPAIRQMPISTWRDPPSPSPMPSSGTGGRHNTPLNMARRLQPTVTFTDVLTPQVLIPRLGTVTQSMARTTLQSPPATASRSYSQPRLPLSAVATPPVLPPAVSRLPTTPSTPMRSTVVAPSASQPNVRLVREGGAVTPTQSARLSRSEGKFMIYLWRLLLIYYKYQ